MSMPDSILEQALARRPAGRPKDAPDAAAPLDAFRAAARQLYAVLLELSSAEWAAAAHADIGSVHAVIAHLTGVEELARSWVTAAGEDPVATDHLAATRPTMDRLAGAPGPVLAERWYDAATAFADAAAVAAPDKPVLAHDLPTDVDGLLVLRSFELWAHLEDVCLATGRPRPVVEADRLTMMSTRLVSAAPVALFLRGEDAPTASTRFVLTGPGGGCHDVQFAGPGEPEEPLTIVVDTEALCRVAARRLPVAELDAVVASGAATTADRILRSLDAFARD